MGVPLHMHLSYWLVDPGEWVALLHPQIEFALAVCLFGELFLPLVSWHLQYIFCVLLTLYGGWDAEQTVAVCNLGSESPKLLFMFGYTLQLSLTDVAQKCMRSLDLRKFLGIFFTSKSLQYAS